MNLEALIVLPQVTQAIRSRAVHVVRDRFAAPGFSRTLAESTGDLSNTVAATKAYTVKDGDFLTRIVRDHLRDSGQAVSNSAVLEGMKRVAEANGIDDPDMIHPGQQLDLSALSQVSAPAKAPVKGQGGRALAPLTSVPREKARFTEPNQVQMVVAEILGIDESVKAVATSTDQSAAAWTGVLGAEAEISSPYGYRRDPFTGGRRFHHGVDLAVPTGTKVHPLEAGEVVFSGWKAGYGRVVIVRHDEGVESVYGHASKTLAKVGKRVTPRDTIALSGSSGRSTGPHLHLEVRRDGETLDPTTYSGASTLRLASNN